MWNLCIWLLNVCLFVEIIADLQWGFGTIKLEPLTWSSDELIKFQELVYSESIDVMFVTETWLNSNISDREILPIGYDIYRTDRSLGRPGGGILIATKQDTFIICNQISSVSMKNLEAVAIECTLPNHTKWLVVCCYKPPDSNDICLISIHLQIFICWQDPYRRWL
jgi:hypothetical protein